MARLRLFKRGDVWWTDGFVGGKRVRKSTGETDEKRAEEIASKREWAAHQARVYGEESVFTFGAAVGLYTDKKAGRYVWPIFDRWKHKLVKDIKPGHVTDLADEMYPKAEAATKNRQVITPITAVINYCAKRGKCHRLDVERFKVVKKPARVADMVWLGKFMRSASPHLGALAQFMAMTGARISDATALDWEDVNLFACTALLRDTKNGDDREAYLPPALLATLEALEHRKGKVFLYAHRHSVRDPWIDCCARAGIDPIPPHDAGRRLFATMMIQAGIDPVTVAKAGGWKTVRMVLEVYAQPGDTQAAVKAVFGNKVTQPKRKTPEKPLITKDKAI